MGRRHRGGRGDRTVGLRVLDGAQASHIAEDVVAQWHGLILCGNVYALWRCLALKALGSESSSFSASPTVCLYRSEHRRFSQR